MRSDYTIVCALAGLALIVVGAGLRYAYGGVLASLRESAPQGSGPNAEMKKVLLRFVMASGICIGSGCVLLLAAILLQPAQGVLQLERMRVPISLGYAAALGLLLLFLSYNVLKHRVGDVLGCDPSQSITDRVVRVHANFAEYVPSGLALLIVLEWSGAPAAMVHFGGIALTLGRYLHAWGYTHHAVVSFGRIVGIQMTLFALAYLVLATGYCLLFA